ncbi:MAG: phosphatase PAP2 family protein [Syntrophobacteraceae bacterium]
MRLDGKSWQIVGIFAICGIFIFSGYFYLDTRLSVFITQLVGKRFLFSKTISNLPDFMLSLVCATTCFSWAGRLYLSQRQDARIDSAFLEYMGSALPLSFILKTILKDFFGRTNTRVWLLHPDSTRFHWFHGGGDFSSFPSGHMAIFTVLMIGISRYFPRLRLLCAASLLALAVALMVTQYHFLSDVAAGVLVGVLTDLLVQAGLSLLHSLPCSKAYNSRSKVL